MLGDNIAILCCRSGVPFGTKLAVELEDLLRQEGHREDGPLIVPSKTSQFANTALLPRIEKSVRGKHVYIVADCENHTDGMTDSQNFDELLQMIYTAKRVSAERMTVITPCLPDARQDKAKGREPITSANKIREIESAGGVRLDGIIAFDLHNRAAMGFSVDVPLNGLYASRVLVPYLTNNLELANAQVWGADLGRATLARYYAEQLRTGFGVVYKLRDYAKVNSSEVVGLLGDPNGKDIIIIDDMIDTGTTIINAVDILHEKGANKIYVVHVHSMFNPKKREDGSVFDPVVELGKRYGQGIVSGVIGTDTVYNGRVDLTKEPFYTQVSVAGLLAKILYNMHTGKEISPYLE